jgi:AcrR family transcriptional regulator
VDAAIEVIDADGLQACTMRSVANRLGVEPMSLYWHVANKDDLLDAVIARVLDGIAVPPADGPDWRAQLTDFATAFRAMVLAHPQVATLIAQRPVTGYLSVKRIAVDCLMNIEQAGFSAAQAIDVMRMVARFVMATAIADAATLGRPQDGRAVSAGPEMEALLRSLNPAEAERLFVLSVETFLNGVEATLPRQEPVPPAG